MKTKYMVQVKWPADFRWELCHIGNDGILWIASTARKSLKRNPSVFETKKEIEKAIKRSKAFATEKGYRWKDSIYNIIPVTVL